MSRQVNVQSLEALRRFRGALQTYAETVQDVLDTLQLESQRTVDWIHADRMSYWPAEIRRASDKLAAALTVLEMKQITVDSGEPPSATEERARVQRARERLRLAEEKRRRTQVAAQRVDHQADEYRGRLGKLTQMVEADLPNAIARLDRMIEAIERYAQTSTRLPPGASS